MNELGHSTQARMAKIIYGDSTDELPPGVRSDPGTRIPPKPAPDRKAKVDRGILKDLKQIDEFFRNDEVDEASEVIKGMFKKYQPTKKMNIKAFLALAQRLTDHHRYPLAVKLVKWVLKPLNNHSYQCHNVEALHAAGVFLSTHGRHTQARKAFRLINDCQPSYGGFFDLALTYELQDKLDRAIENFRDATLIEPKEKEGHHALAKVLHKAGQLAAAMPHYRKAKKKNAHKWFESKEMAEQSVSGWPELRAAIARGDAQLLSENPFIAVWPNYISDDEADMLLDAQYAARARLTKPPLECYHTVDLPYITIDHNNARVFKTAFMDLTCIENDGNVEFLNNITHSLSTFFYNGQNAAIDALVRKLEHTLDRTAEHSLLSQLLQYDEQDSYESHADCAPGFNDNDRAFTSLVYLNTLDKDAGGGTRFDKLNITVQPEKGTALFFDNLLPNGLCNMETTHVANKVSRGHTKYVFQKWFARVPLQGYRPYPSDHPMFDHVGHHSSYLNCRTIDSCRAYQFYDPNESGAKEDL